MPSNRVQADSFLTLHYRLAGPDGEPLVNTFDMQPATFSLGSGALAAPMEARLIGLEEGAQARFELAAGEAFGERNDALVQRVSRGLLRELGEAGETYAVGDVVRFPAPDGRSSLAGIVREAGQDWLLFDFNHPLAGQPVTFEVRLVGVL